ncbi:hypothetical protein FOMPIDRAFT_1160459 [Fomitopsis schrenkii]|uniref:Uncharacterized protein n=1 Tax=Fomitopsis schrenkii TaxID=2126942 RepID=S8FVK7_FOMSC|nr:hypothetical protein FOMPIDRAFT_1160459 [Fomitopsis schrenkii]
MSSTPLLRAPRERTQPIENRNSFLRASILESALELGVGNGGTVAKWMFSPAQEGDEEFDAETAASPSLTYASTATSEDSFLSNSHSPRPQPGAGILLSPFNAPSGQPPFAYTGDGLSPISEGTQRIQFGLSPSPEPRVISPTPPSGLGSRLRRLRLNTNGEESDGGYLSDSGKGKKDKKEKKSKKKAKDDGNGTEYESDGGYFSEASRAQRKKKKKDKKAAKEKAAESPTTDYETDGGGVGRATSKKTRPRKTSLMSPGTGDESDGGNMSESSAKKRGFFRLNTRSRKKRDAEDAAAQVVPPVPALPSNMMPLPIADRFLRSPTPNMSELSRTTTDTSQTMSDFSRSTTEYSRTATPVGGSMTTADEASMMSYATTELDAGSIIAREGLTMAFGDAKSIHRPSYDVLATFRNPSTMLSSPVQLEAAPSPLSQSASSSPTRSPSKTKSAKPIISPTRSPSKTKSAKPIISAPNTAMLSAKHVPVPLVFNSPSSIRWKTSAQNPHTPGSDYVMVTPLVTPTPNQTVQPGAPSGAETEDTRVQSLSPLPSPSRRAFAESTAPPSPKGSQSSLRPQVLAYYNIPPPTPPPQGPLPDVPAPVGLSPSSSHELSRTVSADDVRARSPLARSPLSASRANSGPPTRALPLAPHSAPMHPARSASESDAPRPEPALSVPIISEPVPRAQRGRVSPFPTSPVQPARALSPMFARPEPPLSAGPSTARADRMARYTGGKPASVDDYAPPASAGWRDPARLDARWAPRSHSALDHRRPDVFRAASPVRKKVSFEDESWDDDDGEDEMRSELNMDDSDAEDSMEPVVVLQSEPEPSADSRSFYPEDDDRSAYSRPETMYSEGDRSSMWSQSDGRRSFFDEEKSAVARERFVRQVEKMYGEYTVPPVPALNTRSLNRGVVG